MTQDDIQRAKDHKRDIWVFSILLGSLLLWNIIFFYTDLWKVYLEPIGFHEWVKGISWFWSTYTDIQNRLTYHDVDVQKYMVILTWGACLSMLLGMILFIYSVFSIDWPFLIKDQIKHNEGQEFANFRLFILSLLPIGAVYLSLNSFADPSGALRFPSFLTLLFVQLIFFMVPFGTPVVFIILVKKILWKSKVPDGIHKGENRE